MKGCKIDFTSAPEQSSCRETKLNRRESHLVDIEITKLVTNGVLKEVEHEEGEYISTIFLIPKPDNTYRMILNLKGLNNFVEYKHFKMEHLNHALLSISPNCYMGSIDLKDAYYTVPIHENYRKFMRFQWRGRVMEYQCLCFGLSSAPRAFTKLMKPIFATLRAKGYISVAYIDDSYLQGDTFTECESNINATAELLTKLGFIINREKSELKPKQSLKFLGFILNSRDMTIRVTEQKIEKLRQKVKQVVETKNPTIRQISELLGMMVAYSIAVPYGRLFSMSLERQKIAALRMNKGKFEAKMTLNESTLRDIFWWSENISTISAPIRRSPPSVEIYTDASLSGWGAVMMETRTGGNWSADDLLKYDHINQLELYAVFLALRSFITFLKSKHVKLHIDNVTAVASINHFGSTRSDMCNTLTRKIWMLAMESNMWLSPVFIKGTLNKTADFESRQIRHETEWMLSKDIFHKLTEVFFVPEIDLFASRLNHQVMKYISWLPDPNSIMVDALSCDWNRFNNVYIFCPFSLIHRAVQKMMGEGVRAILIIPDWPTASWYPLVLRICVEPPRILPRRKFLLQLPQDQAQVHPLYPKLTLLACHVLGTYSNPMVYQKQQFLSL